MRHHYWEWPIATYLFLGGLGGGIFCLASILTFFVWPTVPTVAEAFAWPCFIAILCLGFGCFLLVFELGQPLVFLRVFLKNTSIICWGARILSVCLIFGFLWFLSFIPWEWFSGIANFLAMFRGLNLALAGICGFGIMLYTGILLSSLKAHSFWATPALPVLFTISALSTACACITISVGWWPAGQNIATYEQLYLFYMTNEAINHLLHEVDIILVAAEIVVLLVMVLSFLGAGNKTANQVAKKWVIGKWAPAFWLGMVCCGLVLPELLYVFMGGTIGSSVIAPVLVLCGGLLLRFMIVYSDERAPLPGENEYYSRLKGKDALFLTRWKYGENIY